MKRFLKFLKRLISKDQELPGQGKHQRGFDRYPIEFEVSISFVDDCNEEVSDHAALKDISGSGAMFITAIPEKYRLGQVLKLTIFLAGTDEVSACMKGEATVVRIHELDSDITKDNVQRKGIGVQFNNTFDFKRTGQ